MGVLIQKKFHTMATTRRNRNIISQFNNEDGILVEEQEGLCNVAKEYFFDLFLQASINYEAVLEAVQPCVSEGDKQLLTAPFNNNQFRTALFQMHPDKSQGPDGLNATFYRWFWHIFGEEVTRSCCS